MDERTHTRLLDMKIYAEKAMKLLGDIDENSFIADERTYFSVVKCVEIVGEAAAQIGRENLIVITDKLPWTDIIGMRNTLVHQYSGINASTVYDTVTNFLPTVINIIDNLLKETPVL